METLFADVRYGVRQLIRNPLFALVAIVTLALGIGAISSIFTVFNGVLVSQLPYEDPDSLVVLSGIKKQDGQTQGWLISFLDFRDWQEKNTAFESLETFHGPQSFNLMTEEEPDRVSGELISAGYFAQLGIQPVLGRGFSAEEVEPGGANAVAVIGHGLWQERFGGQEDVLGRTLRLNERPVTIIGVMPRGFLGLTDEAEVWLPLTVAGDLLSPRYIDTRRLRWLPLAVGRLKPGVDMAQADERMATLTANLEQAFPTDNEGIGVSLMSLNEAFVGDMRPILRTLLIAGALVLLIACVNIAALLLARAAARQREIGIRGALGAGRGRLIRQLLTESLVLALVGSLVGLVLGQWLTSALLSTGAADLDSFVETSVFGRTVLLVILAVTALASLIFGLAPALMSSRVDLEATLRQGSKSSGDAGKYRFQSFLVILQVALALMLIVGTGLLAQRFRDLASTELGWKSERLWTARADLKGERYATREAKTALARRWLEELEAVPDLEAYALAGSGLPTDGWFGSHFTLRNSAAEEAVVMAYHFVSPGYFSILGMPLRSGRAFELTDSESGPLTVVISQTVASRYWPNEDPIGQQLAFGQASENAVWFQVVGVVADAQHDGLRANKRPAPDVYFSILQVPPSLPPTVNLLARPKGEIQPALGQRLQDTMRKAAPELPLYDVATLEARLADQISEDRFQVLLMSLFAALALILASVGLYGVISYGVQQRTREIGIRMALGAQKQDLLRFVIGRGMLLTALGVGLGIGAAIALNKTFSSFLHGMSTIDPTVLVGTAVLLLIVAFLACWVPARRATQIEPMNTLRIE